MPPCWFRRRCGRCCALERGSGCLMVRRSVIVFVCVDQLLVAWRARGLKTYFVHHPCVNMSVCERRLRLAPAARAADHGERRVGSNIPWHNWWKLRPSVLAPPRSALRKSVVARFVTTSKCLPTSWNCSARSCAKTLGFPALRLTAKRCHKLACERQRVLLLGAASDSDTSTSRPHTASERLVGRANCPLLYEPRPAAI